MLLRDEGAKISQTRLLLAFLGEVAPSRFVQLLRTSVLQWGDSSYLEELLHNYMSDDERRTKPYKTAS